MGYNGGDTLPTETSTDESEPYYDTVRDTTQFRLHNPPGLQAARDLDAGGGKASPRVPSTTSDLYEEITFSFPEPAGLPHPRLELTFGSSTFDQIRLWLVNNRGPKEFFSPPSRDELGGRSIQKLKHFLQQLDAVQQGGSKTVDTEALYATVNKRGARSK